MSRTAFPFLFSLAAVLAAAGEARAESRVLLDLGWGRDSLDWSIAGDAAGENPDVLSELRYEDLEIVDLRAYWELTLARRFVLGARGSFGVIFDGHNRDSDFAGDGRTSEWSRSDNSADGDEVFDVAVSLGYAFRPGRERQTRLVPQIGYSYSAQNLRMTDGTQTLADDDLAALFDSRPPPIGPFPGLDSTYEGRWLGPWLGLLAERDFGERWGLSGSGEYHWADYDGSADWNLRDDFEHPKSFEHSAIATGVVASLAWHRRALRSSRVRLQVDYEDWSTGPGVDRTFLDDGSRPVTRLNAVHWNSIALSVGFDWLRHLGRYGPAPPAGP